ncbi:MAG: asparagine synthase (glutamine-hydrolyzing) [Actinobacteria bacterium]|nr:asparagine synthase (glutamine-hydrolyzing) [Actinomycetota bacterium]
MCGFVAEVGTRGTVAADLLVRMRDELVHRGPDEAGVWVSPEHDVGFGTRRLRIIDLSSGQQPMSNADGSLVLAYNGELYNHKAIRAELERGGRRFRTSCDTEVVLAAYEVYGDACLERFDGMFAFAIWDSNRRRLFFARDRVGKKPLYYARTRRGFVFASEIKALLRHPEVRAEVDVEALGHYLSFLATPPPQTLFAGVSKLPAAHCGSWTQREGLSISRWWTLPTSESKLEITEGEAAEHLHDLFGAAVEKRMMSDVPIGVFLSGGVDSTANVAFMSRYSEEQLRTFSIAFAGEPQLNELRYAREVSRSFGTNHREIVLEDADVISCIPTLIHHQDEPIADPVCVPLLHLARETKESGVTVVQIGEGSDESFFGYDAYAQVFRRLPALRRLRTLLPRRVRLMALRRMASFLNEHEHEFMIEAVGRGVPAPHGVAGLSQRHKERLLVDSNGAPAFDYLHSLVGSGTNEEEVARLALNHEFALRLPELLLMRIDKMTMAASVEARAPFLDHQLVEFAARLPLSFHWADGYGKRILKRGFEGVVPEAVLRREKQGFGAPVLRWLSNLRGIAERELLREPIFEYLNERGLQRLLYEKPTSRRGFELWVVLNFALWHRHWIEGEDLRDDPSFAPQRRGLKSAGPQGEWT